MFRNYLAAALRNLIRNRLYAAINILGLAIGFAPALLIALFARDELTYDHWIPGYADIYRVSGYSMQGGVKRPFDIAPLVAADALKREFPEVQAITRISIVSRSVDVRNGDHEFLDSLSWADPNLFDVLLLPVLAGDLRAALSDPDGVVITRSMARKYFGRDAPLGETLEIRREFSMHVSAVLEDFPSDTHLDLGIIASGRSANAPESFRDSSSIDSIGYIYTRLAPGASADHLRQGLAAFNDRHKELQAVRFPFWLDRVVAIADIHLTPTASVAMRPAGSAGVAYSSLAIAALIMAVAGFNFVNLTTARAVRRAVEVGVRKASGARRRQLVVQFVGEAVVYAALGMAVALGVAVLALPAFNAFLDRTISFGIGTDPTVFVTILAVAAFAGVAAGAYPAFVLAGFAPAAVLKGSVRAGKTRRGGRQALVGLQFAVLIVLALVSITIHRQVHYATDEALRFDKDQVLLIGRGCVPSLVAGMRTLSGVRNVMCTMGGELNGSFAMEVRGPGDLAVKSQMAEIGFGTFEFYGLTPMAGRFFSETHGGDGMRSTGPFTGPSAVVINESMSRALGFAPADAVGKSLRTTLPFVSNTDHVESVAEIIGVVPDFFQTSTQSGGPRFYFVNPADLDRAGTAAVKLTGDRVPETIAAIDALWKRLGPPAPIDRGFLDQAIDGFFREFTRLGQIVGVFAGVAVFISCLGLFGLAAFAAETRTKEIGVRKALGAGRSEIVRLMLWDFAKPVMGGSLMAWPAAYFISRRWLESFPVRVDVAPWTFIAVSALALIIAVITVAGHALTVAHAEPVSALRYE